MSKLLIEIPPLTEKDSYYLQERHKPCFNYPMHKHDCYELNFVENCSGARRLVGDSLEELGECDLALIGCNLEHVWEQHKCTADTIHEVTIQFPKDCFPDAVLNRRVMAPLKDLLEKSRLGVAFGMRATMRVYDRLMQLAHSELSFKSLSLMNEIFYDLATSNDYHTLASSHFSHISAQVTSRRVQKIKDYIDQNYSREIRMETLAQMVNMTPNALSRFFKQRTNRPISDYINEVRIGKASLLLTDSSMTVVEICYQCGFNTITNFNRTFKARKGCTPTEFRDSFKKNIKMI